MKVFIGGSRKISRLSEEVRRRLDRIIEKQLPVLVGDANGADKAVQQYLHSKDYGHVEVFCTAGECRNNVGGWPVRAVATKKRSRDFSFYAIKDRAMAEEATVGFMLWDGQSKGTLMNALRLIQRQKKVVIYIAPTKDFAELKTGADWEGFISRCGEELRQELARESHAEQRQERAPAQAELV